jgi:D-alanyl-D-alanine carboxypeptidase
VTNANDGLANQWIDGALHVMNAFAQNGAPEAAVAGWTGRWWSHWGPLDLVPMGDKVVAAVPATLTPFADASEISVTDRLLGRVAVANGYENFGEAVRRVADASGEITSVWFGGLQLAREADLAAELAQRHPPAG